MSRLKAFALLVAFTQVCAFAARAEESSSRLTTRPVREKKKSGLEKLAYKFTVGGLSFTESRDEAVAVQMDFNVRVDYRLLPWMKLRIEPRVELFSSRLQEWVESDEYRNKFQLDGTYLSLIPVREFEARAGAIRQDFHSNPLLISRRRTFPGVFAEVSSRNRPVKVTAIAQYVIPTSATLSDEREAMEAVPSFQTQSLGLSGRNHFLNWQINGGHFGWRNLPDKVARASVQQGNTQLETGDAAEAVAGTKLKYGFDGYYWGGQICLCGESAFGVALEYSGLHNERAPNSVADGQMLSIAPHLIFGDQEYEIKYSNYFLEPDATVAKYARRTFGFTNRVGDIVEASVRFRDRGFRLVGQWVNDRTVSDYQNSLQSTASQFAVWVETEYASF